MRCVLFLLHSRGYGYGGDYGDYGQEYDCGGCGACASCAGKKGGAGHLPWSRNSGLFNSCAFVVDMLNASGVPARLVQLDTEVEIVEKLIACEPTDVVIEAFWVKPSTINDLTKQFPTIRFFVRSHSEIPFLAQDSVAMQWIFDYLRNPHMHVAANTLRGTDDLRRLALSYFPHWDDATVQQRVLPLPNYHPMLAPMPRVPSTFGTLNVGVFGAIRPPKNHLLQAISAAEVARSLGKRLLFHVNASRVEHAAGGVLKNLRAFLANSQNSEIVEHEWLERDAFMDVVRRMDIGMQVSLSETFNIVSADFVANDVPIVVSTEIPWADKRIQAQPTQGADIIKKMLIALRAVSIIASNRSGLLKYDQTSRSLWLDVFGIKATGWTAWPRAAKARPALAAANSHL